jgi:hypothetical protein
MDTERLPLLELQLLELLDNYFGLPLLQLLSTALQLL